MDTNRWEGTTKYTKGTNGHEWTRMDIVSCNIFMVFQVAYINRKMQEQGLNKGYTTGRLPLGHESIQSVCKPGRAPIVCEVLEKQRNPFTALDVMPPQ